MVARARWIALQLALLAVAGCSSKSPAGLGAGAACMRASDCTSGFCVSIGASSVCGTGCTSNAECTAGWTCAAQPGTSKQACQCTAVPETCDGADNDCDGVVDNQTVADASCAQAVAGQHCQAGSCTCPTGQTACGASCVNTQTDVANCGGCGVICGGTCPAGHCLTTLASGQVSAYALAVDATSVYFTNYDTAGTVMKVSINGGTPVTLASGQNYPGSIAVDSTSVYWTQSNMIMKLPTAGGTPVVLATGTSPVAIALDATNVYWTDDYPTIRKVAKAGGGAIALGDTFGRGQWGIAVDATNVYFSMESASGVIGKVPIARGTATQLAVQIWGRGIAIGGSNLYWVGWMDGTIKSLPVAGGVPTTLATGQDQPSAITVDATNIYWTNINGGTVMEMPLAGDKPPTMLAADQIYPGSIAVDATSVYWTAEGNNGMNDGTVVKTAK